MNRFTNIVQSVTDAVKILPEIREYMLLNVGSNYSAKEVQVGTKHHEATGHYENKWVQDKAAWTETKTVGWKCSCGAKK